MAPVNDGQIESQTRQQDEELGTQLPSRDTAGLRALYVLRLRWDGGEEEWLACGASVEHAAQTLHQAMVRFTSRELRHAGRPEGKPEVRVQQDGAVPGWSLELRWPDEMVETDTLEVLVLQPGTCTRDGRAV